MFGHTEYEYAYPIFQSTSVPPPSKLGYHTNNKYDNFPPLMSDGRAVTASWQPEAVLNEYLIKNMEIKSNWQYRQYLTKNAKEIMKYNCSQLATDAGYLKRYTDLESNTISTPHSFKSLADNSNPVDYQQQKSDLKELYLSREELQSRMVAPEISQDELLRQRSQQK